MLTKLIASWMAALVFCPFTAPFSASDPVGLFGDATKPRVPLAAVGCAVTPAQDATSIAIVPSGRARAPHGVRFLSPAPWFAGPACSTAHRFGPSRGSNAPAGEPLAPPVLRL